MEKISPPRNPSLSPEIVAGLYEMLKQVSGPMSPAMNKASTFIHKALHAEEERNRMNDPSGEYLLINILEDGTRDVIWGGDNGCKAAQAWGRMDRLGKNVRLERDGVWQFVTKNKGRYECHPEVDFDSN